MIVMKVAVITCYRQPDYVRAVTLRNAIEAQDSTQMYIIRNSHTGLFRYLEVIFKLVWLRITKRPDVYLVTFRGYEILPFVALLSWPKTLIYDEFVSPLEWLQEERTEWWAKLIPHSALKLLYRILLRRCKLVLADTEAHVDYSSKISGITKSKFKSLPVGTDESIFKPAPNGYIDKVGNDSQSDFKVFYYGSMLGLHGLDVVMDAALKLKDQPIEFVFAGGGQPTKQAIAEYQGKGAKITHHEWIEYSDLPKFAYRSQLTLGGPFGVSPQAKRVITGKTYQFLACQAPVLIGQNLASGLFIDKQNCLSIPLGDAQALADKILWAQQHPAQLKSIAAAGRELYDQNFSSSALAVQTAEILKTTT